MIFSYISPAIIGCLVTFVIGVLIILTQRWHGRWTLDEHEGVQKFHSQPTPRIGGLAIVSGAFISGFILDPEVKVLMLPLLISGFIPFLFGFLEDLTKKVSVSHRLFGVIIGAVMTVFLTNSYLNRIDIPMFDFFLALAPIGIGFTIFAVAGITNAFNILDGFNGLTSGTVIIILGAFAIIAYTYNDLQLFGFCLIVMGASVGFFLINYPFGKIFLGDSGAYFLGFLIGWIAILLPVRHEEVSPWASLLICAYPVTEVIYSIIRRAFAGRSLSSPDCYHLHSLIKEEVIEKYFVGISGWSRNALVAPSIWIYTIFACVGAVRYHGSPKVLGGIYAGFVVWYWVSYRSLFKKCKSN